MAKPRRYSDDQAAADLANALMDLPDDWVMCRDMRHAWHVMEDFHVSKNRGHSIQELNRTLICMRCTTLRIEVYHSGRFGLDKVRQHYTYPDNYQIKGVPRGVKPQSIVQNEQYRRAMERAAGKARA
jgi:hypothetical protein